MRKSHENTLWTFAAMAAANAAMTAANAVMAAANAVMTAANARMERANAAKTQPFAPARGSNGPTCAALP